MRAAATLTLTASGRLRRPARLRAVAPVAITAAAFAPQGLGAKLQVIRERFTNTVLHQSLQVWVNTMPPGLRLALRVDDSPAVETLFAWENPHGGLPAVLNLAGTALPQDGFTHYLTVSAWRETGGIASARSSFTFPVQLAAPPVPMPEWVGARLLRQNGTELPDLVEITWRAQAAVAVVANLRPQASGQSAINLSLGKAADRDESCPLAEEVARRFTGQFALSRSASHQDPPAASGTPESGSPDRFAQSRPFSGRVLPRYAMGILRREGPKDWQCAPRL